MVAIRSTEHATRYRLTKDELLKLIDKEASRRLGISGDEFMRRLCENDLPETMARRDIEMLVRLLGPKWRTAKSFSHTLTR